MVEFTSLENLRPQMLLLRYSVKYWKALSGPSQTNRRSSLYRLKQIMLFLQGWSEDHMIFFKFAHIKFSEAGRESSPHCGSIGL